MQSNSPIINCHTHIFTGDCIPPYIGKTLMPYPLYYIINIKLIIAIVRSANDGWLRKIYFSIKTPVDKFVYWWQGLTEHYYLTKFIARVIKFCIAFVCFIFMVSFLLRFFEKGFINVLFTWIITRRFVLEIVTIPTGFKILILLISLVLVKWVRNITKALLFYAFKFLKDITGSANVELLRRYYNIAVLSKDRTQEAIFRILKNSYPANSKFIVLPMDLDYMDAGKPNQNYLEQLNDLIRLKQDPVHNLELKPFVFADPRRIEEQPEYYKTIIDCLEKENFSGIKIYPALGYYPFDKHLLELFLYACNNEIPILTHCIRGIIFYRGLKKKEWDHHPIFTETEKGEVNKLKLKEFKNIDFINNFTHPLNYLCLLDPKFLKIVLFKLKEGDALTNKLYALYQFTKNDSPESSILINDLKKLKLCFGHFGGEDEWAKYISKDRSYYENKFMQDPLHFDKFKNPTLAAAWHKETWYSIIRSIIMNPDYPNVYADISFIIYDDKIISLLKSSLQVHHLQDRILYGTDFYVVRQKGTDKKFWLDILGHLDPNEIDKIAVVNSSSFVK